MQHGQTDAAAAHARSLAERDEKVVSLTAALAAARATTDIEPLNNKLRSLTTDVTTSRQALAARESELIALRTAAAKSQSQIAELEAQLMALSDSHAKVADGHAQTLVERDATIAVISTALEKSRLPLTTSIESKGHAQALASDLTAAQQALAARDAELVAQRHAAEALRTRLLTLEGQLSAGQAGDHGPLADADELREHLAILQEDAAHRTTELARVRAELSRLAALPAALKAAQEKANAHALMATDWQNRFAHLETEMASSTHRLTAAAAAKEAASAQGLAAAQAEVTRLGHELRAQIDKLQLDLRQAREDSKARATELARASAALTEMEAALKSRATALDSSTQAAKEFESDLVALRTRHAELENRWQRAAKAEIELRRLGDRYQTLAARFQAAERERSEWALRFAEIERAEAARQTEPMPLYGDEQAPDDDLTQLPGVTPALAAMLNGLDVQRFQQVALWDDQDVEFYDRRLKGHQGQIRRDRWVRSAAELHHRKYGEWLIDTPT